MHYSLLVSTSKEVGKAAYLAEAGKLKKYKHLIKDYRHYHDIVFVYENLQNILVLLYLKSPCTLSENEN